MKDKILKCKNLKRNSYRQPSMSGQRDVPVGKGIFLHASPKVSNIKTKKSFLRVASEEDSKGTCLSGPAWW